MQQKTHRHTDIQTHMYVRAQTQFSSILALWGLQAEHSKHSTSNHGDTITHICFSQQHHIVDTPASKTRSTTNNTHRHVWETQCYHHMPENPEKGAATRGP